MPKKIAAKKTKLAHRLLGQDTSYFLYIFILVPLIAVFVWLAQSPAETLNFGDIDISIEEATTQSEREKGLGNRDNLRQDKGMLFVFESVDYHCFWMKDMKFSIDIIWLDEERKVVDIMQNVDPATYPENFCPKAPAKYVLEVNSGLTASSGVGLGSKL